MKIVQIIPGAGNTFYCENCLRDSSLSRSLREQGHEVQRIPLYLPILTDDPDCTPDAPIFFGGLNVYLQQKSALFRKTPRWIDRLFDSPTLLRWAAGRTGMTKAEDLAETTLSMLRGEEGRQVKELERLVAWLSSIKRPDVIHISNALLLGMVRRIKQELQIPVVCSLQDEDIWVDNLPVSRRQITWETIAERAADVDAFISVSKYYKDLMCERLRISPDRVHVIYNGLNLEGYEQADLPTDPPVIGYLERQCREKGLGMLIEAFIILKSSSASPRSVKEAKLRVAGGKTADDEKILREARKRLKKHGLSYNSPSSFIPHPSSFDVEFLPNLSREEKLSFLRGLSIMSVPAEHRDAFGVYIIESLASGVPVVQPRHGAFPELLEITGGGILCEPDDPHALADAIRTLLLDPEQARKLGRRGRKAVFENFSVERMARDVLQVLKSIIALLTI